MHVANDDRADEPPADDAEPNRAVAEDEARDATTLIDRTPNGDGAASRKSLPHGEQF
jgi:hypothetical protein